MRGAWMSRGSDQTGRPQLMQKKGEPTAPFLFGPERGIAVEGIWNAVGSPGPRNTFILNAGYAPAASFNDRRQPED